MLRCAREANQHLIDFTVVRAGASDYMRGEEIFSPMGSIVLLDLMGGVALLLWGLHMGLSGVLRAYGPDLRRTLSKALGNRFTALGAGLGLTALLQSSTATGLMTASL